MKNVLILFAHPRFEKSQVNTTLIKALPDRAEIFLHDLYEAYPDFNIDIEREKGLLIRHEVIVWHHPFYWYSAPPLLKQWIDMVLEFGWAYGPGGTALKGKAIFNAITSGGPETAYSSDGPHCLTIREFLAPFEQTARLCQMLYLPPFTVHGTHRLSSGQLQQYAASYRKLIGGLVDETLSPENLLPHTRLNDAVKLEVS